MRDLSSNPKHNQTDGFIKNKQNRTQFLSNSIFDYLKNFK